ncbi:hypothetical protein B0T22DRAFT_112117 [Podospora appendiculata]|uniref:Uncharacterized protein n=1 Tax=Podospora appendiculata TaxID=314037 RepID=A0AAE0XLD0_9PEZI|nr:hypothetical protein B0T22DRAFT_112117 [Podospora appendiculata]
MAWCACLSILCLGAELLFRDGGRSVHISMSLREAFLCHCAICLPAPTGLHTGCLKKGNQVRGSRRCWRVLVGIGFVTRYLQVGSQQPLTGISILDCI